MSQVVATLLTIFLAGYLLRTHATEEAARAAQERTDRSARVQDCFDANAQAPVTKRFLNTLHVILENQVLNTQSRIQNEGTTPQLETVLRRAKIAENDVRDFDERVSATAPTASECRRLAKKLGVQLP